MPAFAVNRQRVRLLRRHLLRVALRPLTLHWQPYSRLLLVDDEQQWVLHWELRELQRIAQRLGVQLAPRRWLRYAPRQTVFYGSRSFLLRDWWREHSHRVGFPYFHGLPGSGYDLFDRYIARIEQHHEHIQRIQVSHRQMHTVMLNTGIDPAKVFVIPIGINPDFFRPPTPAERQQARARLGIPASAVVVGSFQKDGDGWGAGMSPKLVKGPDVFLETIAHMQPQCPDLFVLLSGPARGYVKSGLERLGVPSNHLLLEHYPDIGRLYHALDLYIVASRQEGGPKAVLESMASGVPLVSTRVGQASDLVRHGENGWLAEVEASEALAHWALHALHDTQARAAAVAQGVQTAAEHTYAAQLPLWREFLRGFVITDDERRRANRKPD